MSGEPDPMLERVLSAWRAHQRIQMALIEAIPDEGFAALPTGSRGRTVGAQLAHCQKARLGWLLYQATGGRPVKGDRIEAPRPTRAALRKAFESSGRTIEKLLRDALVGRARIRMFDRNPVQWMGYLISHESHHRGQILLALKQNGLRLPDRIAINELWGGWWRAGPKG